MTRITNSQYPTYYTRSEDREYFGIKVPFTKYIVWIFLNRKALIYKPFYIKEIV